MSTNLTTWLSAVKERLEKATPKQFLDRGPADLATAVKIIDRQAEALERLRTGIYHHTRATSICDAAQAEVAKILEDGK